MAQWRGGLGHAAVWFAFGRRAASGSDDDAAPLGVFEKDHALARRFQKIDVNEPTIEQTVQILRGLKSKFEEHHNVKYSASALTTAAELSARFINDRHLPDKAIDVIDEAGAAQRILPKSKQKKTIGKADIEDIIAKIARIPPQTVNQDDYHFKREIERMPY